MTRGIRRWGLVAVLTATLSCPTHRAWAAESTRLTLAQVDSLLETADHLRADHAVAVTLESLQPHTPADSMLTLPWWTRRLEYAPRLIGLSPHEDSLKTEQGRLWLDWAARHANVSVQDRRRLLVALASLEAIRAEIATAALRLPLADSLRAIDRGPLQPWDANRWAAAVRIELALGHTALARAAVDSVIAILQATGSPRVTTAFAHAQRAQIIARSISDRSVFDSLTVAERGLVGLVEPYTPAWVSLRLSQSNYLMANARIEESLAALIAIDHDLATGPNPRMLSRAVILNQIAGRLRRLARLAEAREYAARSLTLMRERLGPDAADVGFSTYVLANIERELGQYELARVDHTRALDLMRRGLGARHPNLIETWLTFAGLERQRGALDAALAALDSADVIAEMNHTPPDARALQDNERATVLGDLGRFADVAPLSLRSAQTVAATRGPGNHYVTTMLETAARGLRAQGHWDSALVLLDTVRVRRLRQFGPRHPIVAATERELAFTEVCAGQRARALTLSLAAATTSAHAQRALLRGLDEQTALAALTSESWTARDLALTLIEQGAGRAEDIASAYGIMVGQRSLLTDELLQRRRLAAREGADSLQHTRGVVRAATARLMLATQSSAPAVAALDSLLRLERQLDLALAFDGPEPADTLPAPMASALPRRSALASFMRYRSLELDSAVSRWSPHGADAYGVFLLRAEQPGVRFLTLGPAALIDSLVERWQLDCRVATSAAGERRARASGHALRERWLDPVLLWAGDVDQLHVVLEGSLAMLDPAAMPAASGGYLIEQPLTFVRLGHDADLHHQSSSNRSRKGFLALGGADYSARASSSTHRDVTDALSRWSDCETLGRGDFVSLPATAIEARNAARIWDRAVGDPHRQAEVLIGPAASEHNLRLRAPHHDALHIATHGFQLGEACGEWAPRSDPILRALYRSGLVLAGANRRLSGTAPSDDGLLTAAEVSTLNLEGMRWVTLSACESGLGTRMRNEGLIGLERALRIAGVRMVVTSLWPVGDESAAAWSAAFYHAALEQKLPVPAAARSASLQRLRALRGAGRPTPPRAWDCFVSSGVE